MPTMTAKGKPMMDADPVKVAPPVGDDFNPNMQVAGKPAGLPDRDGPAKRSANPMVKKPPTSQGKGKVVIKKAPPAKGAAPKKIDAKTMKSMRASLKMV